MITYRIDNIPSEKVKTLKQSFRRSSGKGIVLIHPFYKGILGGPNKEYKKKLLLLLTKTNLPVIILETPKSFIETQSILKNQQISEDRLLIVPTDHGNPMPLIGEHRMYDKDMQNTCKILSELGLEKMFLGGRYALSKNLFNNKILRKIRTIREYENKRFPRPKKRIPLGYGCAGYSYFRFIESGLFDITIIPRLVSPDSPTKIKPKLKKKKIIKKRTLRK
jgi:hypothetical protein